jgi:flagellin-like protein
MNKKAISGIVATVIMIALVIAIAGVVWVVVTNLVSEELEEAGTCREVLGKITINPQYTCFNSSSNEFQFSIGIGDIEIEKVIVAISGAGTTKSYEITQIPDEEAGLRFYDGGPGIYLPKKNEGFTYVLDIEERPDSIIIYPVIKGKQCDASDSISEISDCLLLLT